MLGATVLGAFLDRARIRPITHPGDAPPEPQHRPSVALQDFIRSRDLSFFDREDGGVLVKVSGAPDHLIQRDSGGFVRGIMRGLTRERTIRGVGREPVFRLTEWSDGSLTIQDTGTGRSLNLSAYGPTNRLAFETMLDGATAENGGARA